MPYLIYIMLFVIAYTFGFFIGRVFMARASDKIEFDKRDRAELETYRVLVNDLVHLSMEHIETEAFAQIVLDEIRNSSRKEI